MAQHQPASENRNGRSPRVSVLMPACNAERYVAEAVESILAQTFRDFEFVIVDDGSTDGTGAIIERYAGQDDRVRIVRLPHEGVIRARTAALEAARGEFIAIMDADDVADPRRLELQAARLEQRPELVCVGAQAIMIDPDGRVLGPAGVPASHEEIEAEHLRGCPCIYHSVAMVRAAAIRRAGGYRDGIVPGEDYDLWLRLGEIGRLENLPQPLLKWRRTADGLTAQHLAREQEMVARILRDAYARRGLPGSPVQQPVETMDRTGMLRQWGWIALKHGNRGVARHYALKAVLAAPCYLDSWRLAICALRGR